MDVGVIPHRRDRLADIRGQSSVRHYEDIVWDPELRQRPSPNATRGASLRVQPSGMRMKVRRLLPS